LVLAAFVVPYALMLRSQAEDRAMMAASVETQWVAAQLLAADQAPLRQTIEQINSERRREVTVYLPGGDALGARVPPDAPVSAARGGAKPFVVAVRGGKAYIAPVRGLPGGTAVVRTFVSTDQLHSGVTRAWLVLGGISALLLLLSLAVGEFFGRRIVLPAQDLVRVMRRLASGELAARAVPAGPAEIRQVGADLNGFADRVRRLLASERHETTEFARQLRTAATSPTRPRSPMETGPLRKVRAARLFNTDSDVPGAAAGNADGAPSRVDGDGNGARCDLAAQTVDRARYWSGVADEQGRDLQVTTAPSPILVHVAPDDVAAVIDSLVGNVLAHTPSGTPLWILAESTADGGRLIVEDAGPGFTDPDAAARGVDHGAHDGPGEPGLEASRRIAEASGGEIKLDIRRGGGAQVVVDFG
jgi:hypothetical protein